MECNCGKTLTEEEIKYYDGMCTECVGECEAIIEQEYQDYLSVCEWKALECYTPGFKVYKVGCCENVLQSRHIDYDISNDTCQGCGKKIKEVMGNDK